MDEDTLALLLGGDLVLSQSKVNRWNITRYRSTGVICPDCEGSCRPSP